MAGGGGVNPIWQNLSQFLWTGFPKSSDRRSVRISTYLNTTATEQGLLLLFLLGYLVYQGIHIFFLVPGGWEVGMGSGHRHQDLSGEHGGIVVAWWLHGDAVVVWWWWMHKSGLTLSPQYQPLFHQLYNLTFAIHCALGFVGVVVVQKLKFTWRPHSYSIIRRHAIG